jgi:hypothetical protein
MVGFPNLNLPDRGLFLIHGTFGLIYAIVGLLAVTVVAATETTALADVEKYLENCDRNKSELCCCNIAFPVKSRRFSIHIIISSSFSANSIPQSS